MITAHLPAGYLTGRAFARAGPVVWAAVLGGGLPDLDLIWFYVIDNRALHHHHYWVHIPAFWAVMAAVTLPLQRWVKPGWTKPTVAFFAAISVHLCLDTIAGDIKWLWPISDAFFHLVTVHPTQPHWILNFILHPVFLLELAIWAAALFLWRYTAKQEAKNASS